MAFLKEIKAGNKTMNVLSDQELDQVVTQDELDEELDHKQNKLVAENGIIIDQDTDEILIDLSKFKEIHYEAPPAAPTTDEKQSLYIHGNKWYKWDETEGAWVVVGEGEISDDYKKILFTALPATPTEEQKKTLYVSDNKLYKWDEVNDKWDSAIQSLKYAKDYDADLDNLNAGVVIGDVEHNVASGQFAVAEGNGTEASGKASHSEGTNISYITSATPPKTTASEEGSHAEGRSAVASGKGAHAEGNNTLASGVGAHAEGNGSVNGVGERYSEVDRVVASGPSSHAEGTATKATGPVSHAEGYNTQATNHSSHSEGMNTVASGPVSHAEGGQTVASGGSAHSEGDRTAASGNNAHAEGQLTTASGLNSHAEGEYTIASKRDQHVQGKFNIEDTDTSSDFGKYAHIVGNGANRDARSNAHTLDWEGNAWFAGKVTAGADPTADLDLVTKRYLVTQLANLEHPKMTEVATLPTTGQQTNTIYLVPKIGGGYEMYLWDEDNSDWIDLGKDEIDLSEYMKKTDDAATAAPLMDGTAAVGTAQKYAREDHVHPADTSKQDKLTAGENITLNPDGTISATDTTYSAGDGITITGPNNSIGAERTAANTYTKTEVNNLLNNKQDKLTAGTNITIGEDKKISATDTTYAAGDGISISGANNTIAAERNADNTYTKTEVDTALAAKQDKLTAGANVSITGGTISATDTTYTAGDGINIDDNNEVSANIANSQTTTSEGYALDARQANPNIEGTIGAKIKALEDELAAKGFTKVTTSYGINAWYKKQANINFIHIEGTSSGSIGPNGHSFSLPDSIPLPPFYYSKGGFDRNGTTFDIIPYLITLNKRTVSLYTSENSKPLYYNADFIY